MGAGTGAGVGAVRVAVPGDRYDEDGAGTGMVPVPLHAVHMGGRALLHPTNGHQAPLGVVGAGPGDKCCEGGAFTELDEQGVLEGDGGLLEFLGSQGAAALLALLPHDDDVGGLLD